MNKKLLLTILALAALVAAPFAPTTAAAGTSLSCPATYTSGAFSCTVSLSGSAPISAASGTITVTGGTLGSIAALGGATNDSIGSSLQLLLISGSANTLSASLSITGSGGAVTISIANAKVSDGDTTSSIGGTSKTIAYQAPVVQQPATPATPTTPSTPANNSTKKSTSSPSPTPPATQQPATQPETPTASDPVSSDEPTVPISDPVDTPTDTTVDDTETAYATPIDPLYIWIGIAITSLILNLVFLALLIFKPTALRTGFTKLATQLRPKPTTSHTSTSSSDPASASTHTSDPQSE